MQVDDGHGGVVTQPVTITVTGTNDTPVITSGTQAGAITELFNTPQPNPTGSATPDTATGTITFTDVDLSDHARGDDHRRCRLGRLRPAWRPMRRC